MDLEQIQKSALVDIKEAQDLKALEKIRVQYLGRKGELTAVLKSLKELSLDQRKEIGPQANSLKKELEVAMNDRVKELITQGSDLKTRPLDVTRPGEKVHHGHLHPLTKLDEEIQYIFTAMNFSVLEGPEIETDYYNFDALNIPPHHPARDMWDTFWLKPEARILRGSARRSAKDQRLLLRTHTSPMQIRYMEKHQPPFQIIVPGYEATDASHEINFYQVEGLMVGPDVTLANFKFIIEEFFKRLFGSKIQFRFRPGYFPFTEPSVEVDIKLKSEWLEVMGAGMVHRKVFDAARYNPDQVQGFAFGMGLDRLAMIKYKIPDIRLFYSGDLRFIQQF